MEEISVFKLKINDIIIVNDKKYIIENIVDGSTELSTRVLIQMSLVNKKSKKFELNLKHNELICIAPK